MALAQIAEITARQLPRHAAESGRFLLDALRTELAAPSRCLEVRGRGLMAGVEIKNAPGLPMRAIKEMLRRGFILLPEGARGEVISLTPPLTITRPELAATVHALKEALA